MRAGDEGKAFVTVENCMSDYFARLADSAMVQEDWDEAVDTMPPQEEEECDEERRMAEGMEGVSVPWDNDWTTTEGNNREGRSWGEGSVGQAREQEVQEEEEKEEEEGEEEEEEGEGEGNSEDGDSDPSDGDEDWTAGQEFDFGKDSEESEEKKGRGRKRGGEEVGASDTVRGKGKSLAELMRKINRGEAKTALHGKTPLKKKQKEAQVHQRCRM